ncbi:lysylphosphatidylglycerol synthase domain-containing protein [Rhizobium sp. Rhizsp82]|uniref:lysylphosphatidylglycerol synthase domain-containing protein n=1 Tax=Rhizobium sp. Rhizsp82 TaxID=3243057 RepID=UPI0039B47DFC
MNSPVGASRQSWFARNRMTLLTVVIVAAYALFIEWFWGWSSILAQWAAVGVLPIVIALVLLTSTYFLRTWRILDYFPRETSGQFRTLFRVTQIHNLLNIMLPFRSGETSFPLLMRTEFGIPLARGTSALLVMRLLDLHALLAAAGIGLASEAGNGLIAWIIWAAFLALPVAAFIVRKPLLRFGFKLAPKKAQGFLAEIENGLPVDGIAFARAWAMTAVNWLVKVLVLAWALSLMGVLPLAASFGGALGGELSSVLPVHAPGGVGTYPAGITAGAVAFGALGGKEALAALAQASINAHLLIIVSALTGTAISLPFGRRRQL